MKREMRDSELVDIYEDMLYERAKKGIRPVLYVSSDKDLECNVLMLLDKPPEVQSAGWQHPPATGIRSQVMTN